RSSDSRSRSSSSKVERGTPTLGEMSGLADLKKEMEESEKNAADEKKKSGESEKAEAESPDSDEETTDSGEEE
ncbi:MAG: hypothetical protein R3222_07735, partial [Balneolaceae bacterium]|nr:hypothetical protein [Balneolaceae bacterium]